MTKFIREIIRESLLRATEGYWRKKISDEIWEIKMPSSGRNLNRYEDGWIRARSEMHYIALTGKQEDDE